jgi:alcohol dehydrogenase YqhD (iron-dependent ADH family)
MENFVFENTTKIIFGKGTENEVGKYASLYGKKVLLHYGRNSIKKYGLYDKVIKSLQSHNVDFVELGGVKANPRLQLVYEGIELCRIEKVDFILAVGGGSVIDSAKAIALGYHYDGDVWDFFIKGIRPSKVLPVGCVLTIPAAGSESSIFTVITKEEGQIKKGYGDVSLQPVFSILNPELTYTLPNYQTACGIVDMLGHVFERYFTNTKNVDLTDRLCESVMRTVIDNAPIVLKDNSNYAARAEIMWAGALAHNGLVGTGRSEDWASHALEHQLSALYDIAHGAGLAIIYPAWMKHVYQHDLNRFAQFAHRIFDIEINPDNLAETAQKGIQALEDFYTQIGMPTKLKDIDKTKEDIDTMVDKVTTFYQGVGNFVKLGKEDIQKIYELAL